MKQACLTLILLLFFAAVAFAKVNINTATVKELEALPGVGTVKAEAIVKHREEKGKFKTIEELTGVKGIGPKLLKKLEPECSL
jgi:competence protein ComEA